MTSVRQSEVTGLSRVFALHQNWPNPFNAGTVLLYVLPQGESVRLTVWDLIGQQVAVLEDGIRQAGSHTVVWDGRDARGNPLASGLYFARLETAQPTQTKRMLLLK